MTSEEEKAIKTLEEVASDDFSTLGDDISPKMAQNILNVIGKQEKLINIFIHNEAVKEGKDFNEIKEKYYECL